MRKPWMLAAAVAIATVVVAVVAGGWDVAGLLGEVWTSLASISLLYVVPALALQTLQTAFAAAAWHGILTYAYPDAVLVVVAFGRSGGKRLVEESSARARELHAEPLG